MPIYQYVCRNRHGFERYLPLEEYSFPQTCDICGMLGQRLISPPLFVSAEPDCCYDSPITGEPITSMAARRNDLAKHHCVPYDPELKKDQIRHQHEHDAALDQSIDEAVEHVWARMPTKTRGTIAREIVEQGTIVTVERTAPTL